MLDGDHESQLALAAAKPSNLQATIAQAQQQVLDLVSAYTAVAGSLIAGDSALIAISTSRWMAYLGS